MTQEEANTYWRQWAAKNRDSRRDSSRRSYQKHRSQRTKQHIKWQKDNSVKFMSYVREYKINRYHNDVCYRLRVVLRARLYDALKNNQKVGSAVRDLGCSVEQLKIHLENQFQDGMNWSNYGEWEIDHIRQLQIFDLTDRSQFLMAFNYTNLRPLWKSDNRSRGKFKRAYL